MFARNLRMIENQIAARQTPNQHMLDLCDFCGGRGLQKPIHAFGLRGRIDKREAHRNPIFIVSNTNDRFVAKWIKVVWLEALIIEQCSVRAVQVSDDESRVCFQDFNMPTRYKAQSLRDVE